jgi:hypothetical protein
VFTPSTHLHAGIPFNDTNFRLAIAEYGEAVLGDHLAGLQVGNEPDLYERHTLRNVNFSKDFFSTSE